MCSFPNGHFWQSGRGRDLRAARPGKETSRQDSDTSHQQYKTANSEWGMVLTGGIARGKSTVAAMLQQLGARIIDADALAREIVEPGKEAWQEIVSAFGRQILRADQSIDREKLRKQIF